MSKFIVTLAIIGCSLRETSSEYNYRIHQQFESPNDYIFGSNRPYTPVPVGPKTSEGYFVDPRLLHHIKHILFQEEINNGPREYEANERIMGIELLGIQQSVEVAQFHQTEEGSSVNNYYDNNDSSPDGFLDYSSEYQTNQAFPNSNPPSGPELHDDNPHQFSYHTPYVNIDESTATNTYYDNRYRSSSNFATIPSSHDTSMLNIDRFTTTPASNTFLSNREAALSRDVSNPSNLAMPLALHKSKKTNEMQYINKIPSTKGSFYDNSFRSSFKDTLVSELRNRFSSNSNITPTKSPSYVTPVSTKTMSFISSSERPATKNPTSSSDDDISSSYDEPNTRLSLFISDQLNDTESDDTLSTSSTDDSTLAS